MRRGALVMITTLGGIIAAVCSRCQSQRNYEFAMDTLAARLLHHLLQNGAIYRVIELD